MSNLHPHVSCNPSPSHMRAKLLCDRLFATPWAAVAHQAPLSMGFSRQEHWSGLPCPPPGDLPEPGIEPPYLMSPALAGRFFSTSSTWKAPGITQVDDKQYLHIPAKPFTAPFLSFSACLHYLSDNVGFLSTRRGRIPCGHREGLEFSFHDLLSPT